MSKPLIIYVLLINIVSFFLMYYDKRCAIRHQWRIPEKTLFGVAIIGGSLGANLGMQCFRHKTKHPSFVIGMPLILAVQLGLLAFYYFR